MSPLRRQFVFTLVLLPLAFGLWYAAGALFAAPAAWLCERILLLWVPQIVAGAALDGTTLSVVTHWGQSAGQIIPAADAGNQIIVTLNTRLVSYGVAFYVALLGASADDRGLLRLGLGLLILWLCMAFGLTAMLFRELMPVGGGLLLQAPTIPNAELIALAYQFSVLMAPTLLPVAVWAYQLRGSPLWEELLGAATPTPTD